MDRDRHQWIEKLERLGRPERQQHPIPAADADVERLSGELGAIEGNIRTAEANLSDLEVQLTQPEYDLSVALLPEVEQAARRHRADTVTACDQAQSRLTAELTGRADGFAREQRGAGNRAVTKTTEFRGRYPLETEIVPRRHPG